MSKGAFSGFLGRMFEKDVLNRYQFVSLSDPQPQDVVVAAFPKSGNTWMQTILAGLKYGLDASSAPDTLIQDLVPDVHQSRVGRRYGDVMCFKSHNFPRPEFRNVIHLVRDGRDVLVSYLHYRAALGFSGSMLELAEQDHPLYGTWGSHARAWKDNPFEARILPLRYEDLLANGERELIRISEFLGLDIDEARVRDVLTWTAFPKMQAREARLGWDNAEWPKDKRFVRRGIAGAFRDEMPGDVIEGFEGRFGNELRLLGYETDGVSKGVDTHCR